MRHHRRRQSENDDPRWTRTRDIHRRDDPAPSSGVYAMRLNRKTQPQVYKRVAIRTRYLGEQSERADRLTDIAIGILGFWLLVVLFVVMG